MHLFQRAFYPGGGQHQHLGAVQRQTPRQFGKTHVVAGHQPHLHAGDLDQRRDNGAGIDALRLLHSEGVVEVQLFIGGDNFAVAQRNQHVQRFVALGRHMHAHHGGQRAALTFRQQLRQKRAVQRLGRLQHQIGIGDIARQHPFRQHQQIGAARFGARHKIEADSRVFLPFAADRELPHRYFHHMSPLLAAGKIASGVRRVFVKPCR